MEKKRRYFNAGKSLLLFIAIIMGCGKVELAPVVAKNVRALASENPVEEQTVDEKSLPLVKTPDQKLFVISCIQHEGLENTRAWRQNCEFDPQQIPAKKTGWYFYYDNFYYVNLNYFTPAAACEAMGFLSNCYSDLGYSSFVSTPDSHCDTCARFGTCQTDGCYVPVSQ
jgi:hypothetical protein